MTHRALEESVNGTPRHEHTETVRTAYCPVRGFMDDGMLHTIVHETPDRTIGSTNSFCVFMSRCTIHRLFQSTMRHCCNSCGLSGGSDVVEDSEILLTIKNVTFV